MEKKTCQICTRSIKAKKGLIAHHGYIRPGRGYQGPSCLGARHLPYEESRDRIPQVIGLFEVWSKQAERRLDDFINNPPDSLPVKVFNFGAKPEICPRPEDFDAKANLETGSWKPDQLYEMEHYDIVKRMKRDIDNFQYDIERLNKRYADWVKV